MNSDDLKLFSLFYIRDNEFLADKDKIWLMEFVEKASDEKILKLLFTGDPDSKVYSIEECDGQAYRIREGMIADLGVPLLTNMIKAEKGRRIAKVVINVGKAGYTAKKTMKLYKEPYNMQQEDPWGPATISLAGQAASALMMGLSLKVNKQYMANLSKKCEREKGMAKKVCFNKIRREAIRAEILSLSSMKIKCRKTKNQDVCIKNIDKRIKILQDRMDSIKVF